MKIWSYYTRLAITDLFRLWSSTQHHVIIVAGICLPILLLLGLKAGHVAKLREDLTKSPIGRQIIYNSQQSDTFVTTDFVNLLTSESPNIELVIPESQRLVTIRKASQDDEKGTLGVTVYPTRPGDPKLDQFGADVLDRDERAIVLTRVAADRLGITTGETVQLVVEREKLGVSESATVDVVVRMIVKFGNEDQNIGYVPLPLLTRIERYVRGFKVDEYRWPAMKAPVRDRYASYLVFCEVGKDLLPIDKRNFAELDFVLRRTEDPQLQSLFGLIAADSVNRLIVYEVYTTDSRSDFRHRISMSPSDLVINLVESEADPVVIAWNQPISLKWNERSLAAVGLSFSERTWLRNHLVDRESAFDYEAEGYSAKLIRNGRPVPLSDEKIRLTLSDGQQFEVQTREAEEPETGTRKVAPQPEQGDDATVAPSNASPAEVLLVPANLLAQIDAYQNKRATFDPQSGLFVAVGDPIRWDTARVYANSIDDVPDIVASLMKLGGGVVSEMETIIEIHKQDDSLQLLVYVVGMGVFLFGVITVFSVLLDSTDRKRGTIGILRVMGVSRSGIFFVVVLRAILIGLFAGILTIVVGYLVTWLLAIPAAEGSSIAAWKPEITILLLLPDVMTVFCGALLVAGVGALVPGFRASRMDPFEAIVEGRFR